MHGPIIPMKAKNHKNAVIPAQEAVAKCNIAYQPVIPTKVGIQDWKGSQQLDSRFRGNDEAV